MLVHSWIRFVASLSASVKPLRRDATQVRKLEYRKRKLPIRARYRGRCSRWTCQARRTLPKHPSQYVREPKCGCGAPYRVDWYRTLKETRVLKCDCGYFHFPHRRTAHR
jgi:hypothetical protein